MVYVAFSGGKDSSVLADLCAFWCSVIGATLYLVFVNTGLEYPEIQKHVKSFAEYLRQKYKIEVVLEILRPQMRFDEVIKTYGYPMISKEVAKCVSSAKRLDSKYGQVCRERLEGTHKQKSGEISLFNCAKYKPLLDVDFNISHRCCDVMKKTPSHDYAKRTGRKQMTAQMADESRLREQQWIKFGCNGFNMSSPVSNPMSFWTEQDVLQYIKKHEIPIASVYGEVEYADDPEQIRIEDFGIECEGCEELHLTGCQRTGCIFCGFGCHREKSPSRFERLKITHPRQYEYCIGGGEYNEEGVWQPNKQGLGMGHVFDVLNNIYGEGFIKY
jgi:3'-phosphoadenosine 5'-phosphosulfate sulfotransferase (PAPS reductase)/FAD synthetase